MKLPAHQAAQLRAKIATGEYTNDDALEVLLWLLSRASEYKLNLRMRG
jgi:hypothetical protein